MRTPPFKAPPGYRWIFCRYFVHYITGERVYPKQAEAFCFLVRGS